MSLSSLYERTLAGVEAHAAKHGQAESITVKLKQGAAFRVALDGQRVTVTLMREHKPVGFPTEESTFCKHFKVPAHARRVELEREGSWYRVAYTWERADELAPAVVEQPALF